jgi:protein-L-isoaspartate(D-aspartate) O-methyltransferase
VSAGQTSAVGELLAEAVAAVPRMEYMFADGRQLPQTTRPELIVTMLRMLDLRPGQRVLEVGTGSGYSTALLAHVVGPGGQVTSVEVDTEVAGRARELLGRRGIGWVDVVCADGRSGWLPAAPFDRLVAWASSPEVIPAAWVRQVVPGGMIVAPLRRNRASLVAALEVGHGGSLRQVQQIRAGFVPLTAEPYRPWEWEPSQ